MTHICGVPSLFSAAIATVKPGLHEQKNWPVFAHISDPYEVILLEFEPI